MRRTLVDLLARNIQADQGDAPAVNVQDDCDLQDLGWMPEVVEQPTGGKQWTTTTPTPRA